MKYTTTFTNQFKRDIDKLEKQGKNTEKIFAIIDILANGEQLEKKYKDHPLRGQKDNVRECHVEPDLLLVYSIDKSDLILYALRAGSHSNIF